MAHEGRGGQILAEPTPGRETVGSESRRDRSEYGIDRHARLRDTASKEQDVPENSVGNRSTGFIVRARVRWRMIVPDIVGRLLGGDEDDVTYRCIRCGDEFDRDYRDCPSCDHPYVSRLDE